NKYVTFPMLRRDLRYFRGEFPRSCALPPGTGSDATVCLRRIRCGAWRGGWMWDAESRAARGAPGPCRSSFGLAPEFRSAWRSSITSERSHAEQGKACGNNDSVSNKKGRPAGVPCEELWRYALAACCCEGQRSAAVRMP